MNSDKKHQASAGERKPVILVVDDDPNNLAVVRDCLAEFEYTILVAEDGETALQRAAYARPDLILLDIMMPGLDGYETCRRLKGHDSTVTIPVIFMTALAETGHKVQGLEVGAVDYITKPFQQEELLARISVHLQIRELTGRLREANENLEKRVEERTIDLAVANRELEDEIAERQSAQEQLQEQAITLEEMVSELQMTQEALIKSGRELRQSQKMEAVGTLAAGIAHDFNNILMGILGYTEISISKLPKDSPAKEGMTRVYDSGLRAADLVKQILTYCRQGEQEMKHIYVSPVVKEVFALLRSSLPATIEIRQEIPFSLSAVMVHADPTQLYQVLMNLGTNALHAMREKGGILSVEMAEIDLDEQFVKQHPGVKTGSHLRLTVSDTGCGMKQEVMERIFDPYFTTKSVGEGTGLGLSVVSGIIKNHGGVISVYSEPDRGTAFHMYLPVVEGCPFDVTDSKTELLQGNERILFVDDEAMLAEMGKEILEGLGYRVTLEKDSLLALERIRTDADAFDLLVTDMTMPGLTGRELADKIRDIRPDMPIIICSGYSEFKTGEEAREAGFDGFLMKPYTKRMLAEVIRSAAGPGSGITAAAADVA